MSGSWNFARRPFQDDRPAWVVAGVLALAGAALLVANLRLYSDYRRQVADTRAEIASLEERQRKADRTAETARAALGSFRLSALAEESRALSRIVAERRFSWTTLLARLERTLPPDVGVARLEPRFDPQGEVSLGMSLLARGREAIVRTVSALSRDPAFGAVALRSETAPEPGSGEPFRFELESSYRAGEKP